MGPFANRARETTLTTNGYVYRCTWCHRAGPIRNGLPFYRYVVVEPAGRRRAVPADADGWSDSDDICPAHVALIRLSSAGPPPAEPCAGDPITRPVVD